MNDDEIIAAVRAAAATPPAPASPAAVAEAEEIIGYPLPTLLRRLYLEVANGEFGPGSNVLGVRGARGDGDWADIIDVYQSFRSNPSDPPRDGWSGCTTGAARSGRSWTAEIPAGRCGPGTRTAAAYSMRSSRSRQPSPTG